MITASLRTEQVQDHRETLTSKLGELKEREASLRQQMGNNESEVAASRAAKAAAAAQYANDVQTKSYSLSSTVDTSVDDCAARLGQIKLNGR